MSPAPPTESASNAASRRATAGAFIAVGLASTGYIPALAAAPLAARDMLGVALWSGLPSAVTIAGTALGTSVVAAVMVRRSRRFGLTAGLLVSTAAAGLGVAAVATGSFALFLLAMFLLGVGFGARHLARYVVAELWGPTRRGASIGLIVWAGTIGAVIGPLLLAPSQTFAEFLGLRGLAGPYLLCMAACLPSALAFLATAPHETVSAAPGALRRSGGVREILPHLAQPRARLATVAMVTGQFVMVLIMSMTPLHIDGAGEGLAVVGLVFGAHTLGMFALSPLTGWLSDRFGRIRVILVGQGMLLAAGLLAATTRGDDRLALVTALFLLGLGWNFGYISSSALLTEMGEAGGRLGLQGAVDTLVWTTAALASALAGVLVAGVGYRGLCLAGALLALVPLVVALRDRSLASPTLMTPDPGPDQIDSKI